MLERGLAHVKLTIASRSQRDAGPVSYQVSKSAVIHLTKTLATRFLPLHIRVNNIAPGSVTPRLPYSLRCANTTLSAR